MDAELSLLTVLQTCFYCTILFAKVVIAWICPPESFLFLHCLQKMPTKDIWLS